MANKVYTVRETPIVFAPSGGDVVFTPTSLANGAGRISAQLDRGSGAHATRYIWRARYRAAVAPTVGAVVRVYLVTSDGTYADGDLGTGDAAVSAEIDLGNARLIGAVAADAASTTKDFVASGIVEAAARYLQVAWWNAIGQALSSTAGDQAMTLTPIPDEIQ